MGTRGTSKEKDGQTKSNLRFEYATPVLCRETWARRSQKRGLGGEGRFLFPTDGLVESRWNLDHYGRSSWPLVGGST